ncbi:hypothetical protein SK128_002025 [Halocaridina rubra]|uniref:Uncharacterized protein n=1 Tax=Halocaridina rubra TaxID=373956 RepID=A0AAN8WIH0_HALRR
MEARKPDGGLTRPPPPPPPPGTGGSGGNWPLGQQKPQFTGIGGVTSMQYGPSFPRWNPGERGPTQGGTSVAPGFLRRNRMGHMGPMGPNLASGPLNRQQPTPTKPKEPDQDEAFVEESGIKLFESRPQTDDDDDDHDDDDEDEDEGGDDEDGDDDPLYELDVLDDTIVEEGEDDEDEDDAKTESTAKRKDDKEKEASSEEKSQGEKDHEKNIKNQSNILKESSSQEEPPRADRSSSIGTSSEGSCNNICNSNLNGTSNTFGNKSMNGSLSSNGSSSGSGGTSAGVGCLGVGTNNLVMSANKRDSSFSSGSSRDSGISDAWTAPEPFTRNKPGRLSLPLNLNARPRHQFTIRRVNEAEAQAPARRTSDYIDNRLAELRTPEGGQGGGAIRAPHSLVWVKRNGTETPGVGKTPQDSSSAADSSQDTGTSLGDGPGDTGGVRPRSGTWSVATSRRVKIKAEREEEVAARQRRKSGDDVLNTAAKEKEKTKEASPGFFESFRRPRSKSDASRVGKKPNLMTNLKNAMQIEEIQYFH